MSHKNHHLFLKNRFRTSVKIRVSGFLMDFFGPTKTEILPNPRPLTLQCFDRPDANGLFGFRVSTDKTTDPPRDEGSNGGGNGPVVVVPRWPPGWPRWCRVGLGEFPPLTTIRRGDPKFVEKKRSCSLWMFERMYQLPWTTKSFCRYFLGVFLSAIFVETGADNLIVDFLQVVVIHFDADSDDSPEPGSNSRPCRCQSHEWQVQGGVCQNPRMSMWVCIKKYVNILNIHI